MTTTDISFGVSLYSYGGDFLVTMTLEDCLADVADMGATDVEILADTHIPGYPTPSAEWVAEWHGAPRPLRAHADLLLELARHEALQGPQADDRRGGARSSCATSSSRTGSASRIVRPKLGVVSLDLIPDPIWRETVKRVLPKAAEYDIRIAPEIHAPTPLVSKIVEDYVDLVRETGTEHFGLLIDTGIFQTAERTGAHSDSVFIFGEPRAGAAGAGRARDVEADGSRSRRPVGR